MDQHIDNSRNEFLWSLLADPANDTRLFAYNLQRLVNDFPQSGILQALLVNASDDKNLKRAAAYFDTRSLFKLVNSPAALAEVPDEKIIKLNGIHANGYHQIEEAAPVDESPAAPDDQLVDIDPHGSETYFSEHAGAAINAEEPLTAEEDSSAAVPEAVFSAIDDENDSLQIESDTAEIAGVEESVDVTEHPSDLPASESKDEEPAVETHEEGEPSDGQNAEEAAVEPVAAESAIEAKKEEHEANAESDISRPEAGNVEPEIAAAKETPGDKYHWPAVHDEADKLIVGNIASTDFFMFDRAFGENRETGKNLPVAADNSSSADGEAAAPENKEHHDLSKYNDDKMPYTFMWWLDKTRKEHAGITQPYVKPETTTSITKGKNVTDELQQQYFENIFHITSVDELDKSTTPKVFSFGMKPKEQVIIERFIKEEPQIKPQSGDKLDNENKAKKSSEDRDELVTETLAAIYADQMLFHKAIAAYKKLMLKYPEKSRYFAGKIEQLEKKTN